MGFVRTTTGSSHTLQHFLHCMALNGHEFWTVGARVSQHAGRCTLHCDTVNGKSVCLVQFSLETTTLDNQIQLPAETCVYNLKCMFYVSKLNICITSFWMADAYMNVMLAMPSHCMLYMERWGGRESEMRRRFATIYDTSHRRVHIHLPFANAHRIYIYGIWICD